MPGFLRIIRTTTKPIQVREAASVELPREAAVMWSFMWDPASSIEFDETVETGVTLPGTPAAEVGEIQAFIRRTANGREASLIEVLELEPCRRAVTHSLTAWCSEYHVLTIEPLGPGSCRLTQEFWADLPAGIPRAAVREWQSNSKHRLRGLMERLSELAPRIPT